jgi:hypothetical protein
MLRNVSASRPAILLLLLAAYYLLAVHVIGEPSTASLAAMLGMTVHLAVDRLIPR